MLPLGGERREWLNKYIVYLYVGVEEARPPVGARS